MYDFAEVRLSTIKLLQSIARSLGEYEELLSVETVDSTDHEQMMNYWRSSDTFFSQSCGQPFVEDLYKYVDVVGTMLWNDVSDADGKYRSVIVARSALGISSIEQARGLRPVVTNTQSLSGWCSLGCALAEVTSDSSFVQPYLQSKSHVKSLEWLQADYVDFASIDAATFRLAGTYYPWLVDNLRIIGFGPAVPATPLIVSKIRSVGLDAIAGSVEQAFNDRAVEDALNTLGINGFIRLANSDYEKVNELINIAEVVLPRRLPQKKDRN